MNHFYSCCYLKSLLVPLILPQLLNNPTKFPFCEPFAFIFPPIQHTTRTQFRILHQWNPPVNTIPFYHWSSLIVHCSIIVDLWYRAYDYWEFLVVYSLVEGRFGTFPWDRVRVGDGWWEGDLMVVKGRLEKHFCFGFRGLSVECSAERFWFLGILLGWVLKIKLVKLP